MTALDIGVVVVVVLILFVLDLLEKRVHQTERRLNDLENRLRMQRKI